jgi:hypothetical protein
MSGQKALSKDMLGSQFFMLRELLLKICARIEKCDTHFKLSCLDAKDLPKKLEQWSEVRQFDRIEVRTWRDLRRQPHLVLSSKKTPIIIALANPKPVFQPL